MIMRIQDTEIDDAAIKDAYRRMAQVMNKRVDELTKAERNQALVNIMVQLDKESDEEDDQDQEKDIEETLPVLLTIGSLTQRPLWERLSEQFRLAFLDTGAGRRAQEFGLKVAVLEDGIDQDVQRHSVNRSLWQVDRILDETYSFDKPLFGVNGVPKLRSPELGNWFPGFAYEILLQSILQSTLITKLQKEHGIAGVLVHEDVTPVGRTAVMMGQALGLPTLHIPHANHFISPHKTDIHRIIMADHLGVAGEYMAGWYEACGVPRSRMELIGVPQWDKFYGEFIPTREHSRKALGLEQGDFVLAYGTTWVQDTNAFAGGNEDLDRSAHIVARTAREMGAKLIFKMHPGEAPDREEAYGKVMEQYGLGGLVTRMHNDRVLKAADCLIVQGPSNFGVEATILGTPVVEMYQPAARYPVEYGIPSTWGEGLSATVEKAIKRGPNPEFAVDMNYGNDGGAVDRAIEWIMGFYGIS